MRIEVTQQHIDKGIRRSAYHCPVAQALSEATGDIWTTGRWDAGNGTVNVLLPEDVVERIIRYDDTREMQPFAFEMEVEG
jgi:hypothetical protein